MLLKDRVQETKIGVCSVMSEIDILQERVNYETVDMKEIAYELGSLYGQMKQLQYELEMIEDDVTLCS